MKTKYINQLLNTGAEAIMDNERDTADLICEFLRNYTKNNFSSYKTKMLDIVQKKTKRTRKGK